jgi:hypothetical protein
VKQIARLRMTQAMSRYGEHVPAATACCNACRTCVQTNAIGLALAAVAGIGVAVRQRFAR